MPKVALDTQGRWPRLLRRPEAAAYVGVGLTKFDQMVNDGRMPRPKKIDGCVAWDIRALDCSVDNLPDQDETPRENPWDAVLS